MNSFPEYRNALYSALTPRERDVMHYVAAGKANKVIAAELGVSQRTVEAHRARIFQKMRVRNAVELTRRLLLWPASGMALNDGGAPYAPGVAEPPPRQGN